MENIQNMDFLLIKVITIKVNIRTELNKDMERCKLNFKNILEILVIIYILDTDNLQLTNKYMLENFLKV